MITSQQLQTMKQTNLIETDKSMLKEIKNIEVDIDIPIISRFLKYVDEIKNPYCFLNGEVAVKLEFSKNYKFLEKIVINYLTIMKNK